MQPDDDSAREPAGKRQEVLGCRPGKRVDRLVRITDDAQVVPTAQPGFEQPLLHGRDVLVFVDDEMPIPGTDLLGDVRVLLDRAGHAEEQVGEVEPTDPALGRLVLGVDGGHWRGRRGLRTTYRTWPGPGVPGPPEDRLCPLDLGGEIPQLGAVGSQPYPRRG